MVVTVQLQGQPRSAAEEALMVERMPEAQRETYLTQLATTNPRHLVDLAKTDPAIAQMLIQSDPEFAKKYGLDKKQDDQAKQQAANSAAGRNERDSKNAADPTSPLGLMTEIVFRPGLTAEGIRQNTEKAMREFDKDVAPLTRQEGAWGGQSVGVVREIDADLAFQEDCASRQKLPKALRQALHQRRMEMRERMFANGLRPELLDNPRAVVPRGGFADERLASGLREWHSRMNVGIVVTGPHAHHEAQLGRYSLSGDRTPPARSILPLGVPANDHHPAPTPAKVQPAAVIKPLSLGLSAGPSMGHP